MFKRMPVFILGLLLIFMGWLYTTHDCHANTIQREVCMEITPGVFKCVDRTTGKQRTIVNL